MALKMPGVDALPHGGHRDLVAALHDLYGKAGRPGARRVSQAVREIDDLSDSVSHETVASMLRGAVLPKWSKLQAVTWVLATWSVDRPDPDEIVRHMHRLWLAAQPDEVRDGTEQPVRSAKSHAATPARQDRPMTLMDAAWPGKDMLDIEHFKGKTIVKRNSRHPFHRRIDELVAAVESAPTVDEARDAVRELRELLDLVFLAYARATSMLADDSAKAALDIGAYWGMFTASYVEAFTKADR